MPTTTVPNAWVSFLKAHRGTTWKNVHERHMAYQQFKERTHPHPTAKKSPPPQHTWPSPTSDMKVGVYTMDTLAPIFTSFLTCLEESPSHLVLKMTRDIPLVLESLHRAGVVHGDMHAGNIVYKDHHHDYPYIVDFGRAIVVPTLMRPSDKAAHYFTDHALFLYVLVDYVRDVENHQDTAATPSKDLVLKVYNDYTKALRKTDEYRFLATSLDQHTRDTYLRPILDTIPERPVRRTPRPLTTLETFIYGKKHTLSEWIHPLDELDFRYQALHDLLYHHRAFYRSFKKEARWKTFVDVKIEDNRVPHPQIIGTL